MKKSYSNWHLWIIWLLFIVTSIIVFYRAATLSMTHDESASWLYLQENSILPILFLKDAWGTANNHYLNSLLMQMVTSIFGEEEWVIRLPNSISYVLYGFSSIFLISRIYQNKATQLVAAALIFCNVYLIDFFSLGRGYGMSIAFHMAALAFIYIWINSRKPIHLMVAFIALVGATLSMFTHLIYVPVYIAIVYAIIYWQHLKKSTTYASTEIFIPILCAVFVVCLVYIPITTLSSNEEFLWGTTMLEESFNGLISDSLNARKYLGYETYSIIGIILLISIMIGVWKKIKSKVIQDPINTFHLAVFGVLLCTVIATVLSRCIIGTLYPTERKSTMFMPLIFLLVPYGIDWVRNVKITYVFGIVLSLLMLLHFQDKLEMDRTREWYYDHQTKDYVNYIAQISNEEKVELGMNWTFYWSALYYVKTGLHPNIQLYKYPDTPSVVPLHDFMIIHHEEYSIFLKKYTVVTGPNISNVSLLKRNN